MMVSACDLHAQWRGLPVRDNEPLLCDGRALILAPHADDESLGCGGLIAELCERGFPPLVLIATDGTGSHPNSRRWPAPRLMELREDETRVAVATLGLDPAQLRFLRLRDTAAPHDGPGFEAACQAIAEAALQAGCRTLLAPWRDDPHCDHEAVHKMACKVAGDLAIRRLSYPVWGWLLPPQAEIAQAWPTRGFRLDISRHLTRKSAAIRRHASQYSALIDDDPEGFRLPEALLRVFDQPYEIFLEDEPA